MPKKPYMPKTDEGIRAMLNAFDTNINARDGALALKYQVTNTERLRIRRALLAWQWMGTALNSMRNAAQSLTSTRDSMITGNPGSYTSLPANPTLPSVPLMETPDGPLPVTLECGFFAFFASIVARIKSHIEYDEADGQLLGVEGAEIGAPDPQTVPTLHADVYGDNRPVLTCKKGLFQGFDIWLTRPGQPKRHLAFSLTRMFAVDEPLPAAGSAEVWTFEVQYRFQNAPFGKRSRPVSVTVHG